MSISLSPCLQFCGWIPARDVLGHVVVLFTLGETEAVLPHGCTTFHPPPRVHEDSCLPHPGQHLLISEGQGSPPRPNQRQGGLMVDLICVSPIGGAEPLPGGLFVPRSGPGGLALIRGAAQAPPQLGHDGRQDAFLSPSPAVGPRVRVPWTHRGTSLTSEGGVRAGVTLPSAAPQFPLDVILGIL